MKRITLTQGKTAIVDDGNYAWLSLFRWWVAKKQEKQGGRCYWRAKGYINGRRVFMHRLITDAAAGVEVDHRNHDTLDNQRENLRLCTHSQNLANSRPHQGSTSQYKGVSLGWGRERPWEAIINDGDKRVLIGKFTSEEDAARAFDAKAREIQGEYAFLNFP